MRGCPPHVRLLAALSLLAVACASLSDGRTSEPAAVSSAHVPALPAWYLAPPRDDATALYGVGAGGDLPTAKAGALVDVAGKLAVSVRATLHDYTLLEHDQLEQRIESELEQRVHEKEFRGYDVLESALAEGTFYTLVRIDRQRLFRDTLAAFRELDWQASAPVERAMNETPLTYTIAYRASARKLERSAAMLQVLHSLDSGFDVAPHVERHREYRERFDWARGQLVFTLVTDADSEAIGEVVQDLLSREGLQSELVTDGACRGICVEISSRATSRYAARRYMSTVNAMFRVRDGEAAVSASREHQVRGTALVGYPEARSAAIRNFRTNFADEGILEALGL